MGARLRRAGKVLGIMVEALWLALTTPAEREFTITLQRYDGRDVSDAEMARRLATLTRSGVLGRRDAPGQF